MEASRNMTDGKPVPTIRKITRLEAVRDQLDSAYKTYFLWDDLVSALTLAGAAERVLSDMQAQDGIFGVDAYSIRAAVNLHIKPEHHKEAAKLFRADYDFFRHADIKKDNDYELKEEGVEFWLLVPLCAFEHLKQAKTQAMRAYSTWYFMKHPTHLKDDAGAYGKIIKELGDCAKNFSKQDFYHRFCTVDRRQ
jgi:isocitrate lyase